MLLTSIWGSCLTQVPESELDQCVDVENKSHKPLGFFSVVTFASRSYYGGQRWTEGFDIIVSATSTRVLSWRGVHIHNDRRDLALIFDPNACASSVANATAQRLEHRKTFLGHNDYTIRHTTGERYC